MVLVLFANVHTIECINWAKYSRHVDIHHEIVQKITPFIIKNEFNPQNMASISTINREFLSSNIFLLYEWSMIFEANVYLSIIESTKMNHVAAC